MARLGRKAYVRTRGRSIFAQLLLILFLGWVGLGLSLPGWAQTQPTEVTTRAKIVLDGYELFEVEASGRFSAEERATRVNQLLQEKLDRAIATDTPPEVTIVQNNGQVSLQVNNRHLVTLTASDMMMPGQPSLEQAERWQNEIEQALQRARRERTPIYRAWAIKMALIASAAAIALQSLWFWLQRRLQRQKKKDSELIKTSWKILVLILLQVATWLIVICYVTHLFPLSRRWLYRTYIFLRDLFSAQIFTVGERALSLNNLLLIGVMAIALILITNSFTEVLKTKIVPLVGVDRHSQQAIAFFLRYALLFIGFLLILTLSGVDFSSLAILISVLGVGIGFGLQNIAKDFISGLIMIFERPIQVGELVQVGEFQGLVQRIGPRVTEMTTIDRITIMVPNSRFIEGEVQNWNRTGLTRLKVYVGVAYSSDMQLVHDVLLAVAQIPHPEILRHPPPKAQFRGFGDNALNFRIVVFIRDPLKQPKVKTHLLHYMSLYLEHYGIGIPFPQRDLHIKLPGLEQVADTWLTQQGREHWQPSPVPAPERPKIKPEYNWEDILQRMRGPEGISIRDRRYGLKAFSNCFVGSEAVDWLMEHEQSTRPEAIMMGEMMVNLGIIHHVLDEHGFEDSLLFYRFYADENLEHEDQYLTPPPTEGGDRIDERGIEKNTDSDTAMIDD
ncbi:mechanosensitive ion channel [Roseofilum reptotaenium CS-1145]|uniref:mechanosensitive ion channel domain-containing protein n=1 Tax=Roseofilum reptotaenium TaxID=1233427 RepID=UPI000AF05798|nr:mechanosensitive ion channel domain-containing protein [Roseofilum reptotaenium]MDB9517944.1 mechanosensitive ion channel [Roseofilum reptotaenium CS-1145]